jgi:uncharacterized protein YjbI with pentapeptide repeats
MFMKSIVKFTITVLAIIFLICPFTAYAGSSSAVTSSNSVYNNTDLSGRDFTGENLKTLEFTKVNLQSANFSNADLRGAVFNNSDLTKANLHGVNFGQGLAYLSSFNEADLSDAIFTDAILMLSTFKNANITGADFTFAVLDKDQIKSLCKNASGSNSQTGVNTRDSLGC